MEELIKIVSNDICIDTEELRKIVVDEWQSEELYRHYHKHGYRGKDLYRAILSELDDYIDDISYANLDNARKKLGRPNVGIDTFYDKYPKSDVRSIGFEIVNKLTFIGGTKPIENIIFDDIPAILEFLDTPPGKSLEAWDKWEKYWENLDYPARLKKLMEDERYI